LVSDLHEDLLLGVQVLGFFVWIIALEFYLDWAVMLLFFLSISVFLLMGFRAFAAFVIADLLALFTDVQVTNAKHPVLRQAAIDQRVDHALIPGNLVLNGSLPASLSGWANVGGTLRGNDDVRVARVVTTRACVPLRQRLLGWIILVDRARLGEVSLWMGARRIRIQVIVILIVQLGFLFSLMETAFEFVYLWALLQDELHEVGLTWTGKLVARLLLSVGFPCLTATGVASFPHIVLGCHNILAYV
jgi:hypothetical protein